MQICCGHHRGRPRTGACSRQSQRCDPSSPHRPTAHRSAHSVLLFLHQQCHLVHRGPRSQSKTEEGQLHRQDQAQTRLVSFPSFPSLSPTVTPACNVPTPHLSPVLAQISGLHPALRLQHFRFRSLRNTCSKALRSYHPARPCLDQQRGSLSQ